MPLLYSDLIAARISGEILLGLDLAKAFARVFLGGHHGAHGANVILRPVQVIHAGVSAVADQKRPVGHALARHLNRTPGGLSVGCGGGDKRAARSRRLDLAVFVHRGHTLIAGRPFYRLFIGIGGRKPGF